MSVWTYILKTPIKIIRADFAEYRKLNQDIARVGRNVQNARVNMIVRMGKKWCMVPSARAYAGCVQKSWTPELDIQMGINVLREYECECPLFVPNWWPCNQVNCLYHQFNNKYFENKNIYEVLKRNKSGFWKEKFNRVR